MVGPLPPELSALWALELLDVQKNQLIGPVPAMNFKSMSSCTLLHSETSFEGKLENKFTCPFSADALAKCRIFMNVLNQQGSTSRSTDKKIYNTMCVATCSAGEYSIGHSIRQQLNEVHRRRRRGSADHITAKRPDYFVKQSCTACPGGKYTSGRVQIECDVCPGGRHQLASSASQSTCPSVGATNCTGGKETNALSGATGGSSSLPADQCNAWIRLYDNTRGAQWTKCADARTDPCSCKGSATESANQYTCSPDGSAIERL